MNVRVSEASTARASWPYAGRSIRRARHLSRAFRLLRGVAGLQAVADGPKRIVLVNRGTGKSAIFKVLAERRRKAKLAVIELAPEDYSYEMLSTVLAKESAGSWAKHGAYAVAWKYLIYVLVMRAIVGDATKIQRGPVGRI